MSKFTHLHCHSSYSLLESTIRIKALLEMCKEKEMSSVALTDNGIMYGAIDFYLAARKADLKPIIGCEMYLAKDITQKERGLDRLILLAKDYEGYQNLINLVSIACLDGFYYRPRIDYAHIKQHAKGLIAISPGMNGPIAYNIRSHRQDEAREHANQILDIFKEDGYLGIQRAQEPYEDMIAEGTKKIATDSGLKMVALNDVYYLKKEKAPLIDILQGIKTGKQVDVDLENQFEAQEKYFKSPDEMATLFEDMPEVIDVTQEIDAKCNLEIDTGQVFMPNFECPDNKSNEAYFEELVWEGIRTKYGDITSEIKERVDFELDIIKKMHYATYFLIIYDFLDYCTQHNIPVGPGSGSAAGSIVAYALNITKLDPLPYNLLFERFLNPERVTMPDVDLDFCIKRRNEVIDYIVQRYGNENVCQISTFGTMAARGVIRDVGRALNVPLPDVDRIAKLIPSTPGQYVSIPEALKEVGELKKVYESSQQFKQLIDIGAELEGLPRHTSTHAAGVIISRDPLTKSVPLIRNEGQVSTQYPMADLESVGLLKMDILGLRNLTVIKDTMALIKENHNKTFDIDSIELTDQPTYELLCRGEAMGVFQCESKGMRTLIKDLQPKVFEDVIALLALYRPGPLGSGMVQEFISNKSGETDVKYDLPELEPILKDTYGMIVYQEQVMQIASVIGGFSLGQADMLRRAMGKKKKSVMDEMREEFLQGAGKKTLDVIKAAKVFDLCYKFAEYGFNKSHSAAYALISYQTAFLKANFPNEYMCALLSSVFGFTEKISQYIEECTNMGIKILSPDVNESRADFTITNTGIRFGLKAIKNVGEGAIESIIENTSQDNPYKNLLDFCTRVDLRQVNKRVVESLIKSGGMDCFGDRSQLLATYEKILDAAQVKIKERESGQINMFGGGDNESDELIQTKAVAPLSNLEILRMEKEVLGLYISGHPLEEFKDKLHKLVTPSNKITDKQNNKKITIGGILKETRKVITKTKKEMMIGICEDLHGQVTVLLFLDEKTEKLKEVFKDDHIISVMGRIRLNEDEISIMAEQITVLDRASINSLSIDVGEINDIAKIDDIRKLIIQHPGKLPVYFHIDEKKVLTHQRFWVSEDLRVVQEIEEIVGEGNVWSI